MNISSLFILVIWLTCGFFVTQFVLRTGGTTKIGHVAHWFGGLFVMVGLAVGLVWGFAYLDQKFAVRVNIYLLTHQMRPSETTALIQRHAQNDLVTVYRPGLVNKVARLDGVNLIIDEHQTFRTSLWWMLWNTQ